MNSAEIIEHFEKTDALLEGHFELSSGLHSSKYLQCALALRDPCDAEKFASAIAEKFRGEVPEIVVAPAIGGIIIGYETARTLGVPFIWSERENGVMTLRRGFTLKKDTKVLVIEDVITTGGSTRECIDAVQKHGGNVVGAASIVDRSNGTANVGVKRIALLSLDVRSYKSEECPMCAAGSSAIKPGSRIIAAK